MEILGSQGNLFKATFNIKSRSVRNEVIDECFDMINLERKGTKFKPLSKRAIAIKIAHLKTDQDLSYLTSVCRDSKRRTGSFSKAFFGMLKM